MAFSVGELIGYLSLKGGAAFDEGIASAQRGMSMAGESAARMGAAVEGSEAALAGAGRQASVAASGSAKLRAAQLSAVAAQERYNAALAEGDASVARLASSEASLIRANERVRASQPLMAPLAAGARAAETSVAGLGTRMLSTAGSAAKMGLGLAGLVGAFKVVELVRAGAEFQKQMLQIQTLTGGTATEVKTMSAALLGLSGAVATGPEALATSLYHVESVGLRGAAALDVVKIAAEGAHVGMADVEQTTNALTSSVASGIKGVQNMSQAMGALITIVGAGDMKMSDLNEALGSGILSVAKGYGVSLTEVGAVLATFGDNNIRGAQAATDLRMAMMAFAKPAAEGKKAIEGIGLSMDTLSKDMQTGGLNKAVLDLDAHMKAAGITGSKVGGFITEAFGKKAGAGLAVLMGQTDRFESKLTAIEDGSGSFASKWDATTKTVGFAFSKLGAEAQAAGVAIFEKAGPALAGFANAVGTDVPAAVNTLQQALGPLEHEVGTVLVGAWGAATVILGTVGAALSGVGHFLASHKTLVTTVGTTVLAMWAAYKGYMIAKVAIGAVSAALLKVGPAATAAGMKMSSLASVGGAAMLGLGVVVGVATYAWQQHQAEVAANKAAIEEYTSAIEADNGAMGSNTRALVENNLVKDGGFKAAKALGISQRDLTDAMLGNVDATGRVNAAMREHWTVTSSTVGPVGDLKRIMGANSEQMKAGAVNAADMAAANNKLGHAFGVTTDKLDSNVRAQRDATTAIDGTTVSMKDQKSVIDALSAALAMLSGDANAAALAQLSLEDGLMAASQQVKDNGASLVENTASGNKNLEWVHNQIDAINNVANAQAKNGDTVDVVTAKMGSNEAALRSAAVAAGFNKDQVDALIKKYAAVPGDVKTVLSAETNAASAKMDNLLTKLRIFGKGANATMSITTVDKSTGTIRTVKAQALGGIVEGPGTGTSDSVPRWLSNGEFVINAAATAKNRRLLEAINNGGAAPSTGAPSGLGGGSGTYGNAPIKITVNPSASMDEHALAIATVRHLQMLAV